MYEEIGDKKGYSSVVCNIGVMLRYKGDYDNSITYFKEHKELCLKFGDKRGYSMSSNNLSSIYHLKNDYTTAMKYYDEAINIGKELGIKYNLCAYLNNKARLLFDMNNPIGAKLFNHESLQIANDIDRSDIIFEATVLKHKISAKTSDKNKAIENLREMLDEYKDMEEQACLHYELWKLTGEADYKTSAISEYKALYEKTNIHLYKRNLDELMCEN